MTALGAISFEEGECLAAREYYERALVMAQEQGARPIESRALRGLGDVFRVQHHFAEAERSYATAATIADELDMPTEYRADLRRQGLLSQAQQQYAKALDLYLQALALDQRWEHPARKRLQATIDELVAEQHLEEMYAELAKKYGLG
jgi:tetratricopeptide (TPR) repeat protein